MNTMQFESLANAQPILRSAQEEFDAVVNHLYAQGHPAKNAAGWCAYRGVAGTSCAVGCRIPDEMYLPSMDALDTGGGIYNMLSCHQGKVPQEIIEYEDMFSSLQVAHDSTAHSSESFDFDRLVKDLSETAEHFGLTFTVPTTANA